MNEITLNWLQEQAKILVMKHWGLEHIPLIEIDTNREYDWSNTLALYWHDTKSIEFKSHINARLTRRRVKQTLLHELCHWYLHITNQPFRDKDERFARELIRVRAGSTHNSDEKATTAFVTAKQKKKTERFEIVEENGSETLVSRLRHDRKNQDDFKSDLAETLLRMHNEREEDETIYPGDVASMMAKWYGYKLEPLAKCAIKISKDGGSGEVGNRNDIANLLHDLGMDWDDIEEKLKPEAEEELVE